MVVLMPARDSSQITWLRLVDWSFILTSSCHQPWITMTQGDHKQKGKTSKYYKVYSCNLLTSNRGSQGKWWLCWWLQPTVLFLYNWGGQGFCGSKRSPGGGWRSATAFCTPNFDNSSPNEMEKWMCSGLVVFCGKKMGVFLTWWVAYPHLLL